MKSVLIIIDKALYGYEDDFAGLYVAIACLDNGLDADVFLVGDSVYVAMKDQLSEESIGYPSVGELSYSIYLNGNLFVDSESLTERGLTDQDLVEIAEIIDDKSLCNIC